MKLTDNEAEAIFEELGLPAETRTLVQSIRHGEPVRRSNRRINITGRFPSTKMGLTIQYESRSGEGLACLFYESDGEVLEFYDQPYCFRVPYVQPGSTLSHVEHTPDFLVIRRKTADDGTFTHSITFEEWREQGRMANLAKGDPHRWDRLASGDWTQLPIAAHLNELDLGYRIRLIDATPTVLARNYDLLSDHFLDPQPIDPALLAQVREVVAGQLGISLADALAALPHVGVDEIFAMLAQAKLFTNIRSVLLTDHEHVRLYTALELKAIVEGRPQPIERGEVVAEPGARVRFGDDEFEILSVSNDKVFMKSMRGGRGDDISLVDFMRWAEAGDIVGVSDGRTALASALLDRDPSLMLLARQRFKAIEPYLASGERPEARSARRWLAGYKRAEELHGDGFIGLLSDTEERGNRNPRLAEDSEDTAATVIKEQLLRPDQLSVRKAHGIYASICAETGIHPMAMSTFHARFKILSQSQRLRARVGGRAANAAQMRSGRGGIVLPPHGDRAFARVHIDHTTLDLALRDSVTGDHLGRPECTLVVDAFSRRILVALALFQKPSAETDMLALRELVRKYHQMPTTIVVDGGSDFTSTYFEALCAAPKTKVEHRRTGHARDGGPVESAFNQLNSDLIHNLVANTQITKKVREMGSEYAPELRAVWTLGALQDELDRYVEFKNDQPVRTLGGSPRELFEKSMAAAGPRSFRRIAFTTAFRALTAHRGKNGSHAKVGRAGVRINNLQYWCEAFRQPGVEGIKVKVRYEPLDGRVAYAQVNKLWHVCHAEYPELDGRSEKDLAFASQELRRRLGTEPSMHELTTYLRQVQAREADLSKEQKLRVRRASEQSALVSDRDTLSEEAPASAAAPDAPAAELAAGPDTEPVPTEPVELKLEGYEQPSEDELRELLAEVTDQKEAA